METTTVVAGGAVREVVRTLLPGYFALVMATGIVSVGLRDHGLSLLSAALMWLAGGAYVVLVAANMWRIMAFPAQVRADLSDPVRGFGYFTFVAGSAVLGSRIALDGHTALPLALLLVGGCAWLLLGYLLPWTAVIGRRSRPALPGANGTWFIWVVASQSIAVLAAVLEPTVTTSRRELALLAVSAWSVGVVLYGAVGVLVAARLIIYPVRPTDLTPPYWVAMGATAITVLAGASIVQMADAPIVAATRGLVASMSVVFWAFGTWLIPALVAAAWWRHFTNRVPLRYEATLWSLVFPLGMYGVASQTIGDADRLPVVGAIGRHEFWIAAVVWTVVFVAMLGHLSQTLVQRQGRSG